jgi:hypothetical protein
MKYQITKYGLQGWTTRMNSQLGQPLHMLYDSNMIDRNYILGSILTLARRHKLNNDISNLMTKNNRAF